jgi:hypothetical protein
MDDAIMANEKKGIHLQLSNTYLPTIKLDFPSDLEYNADNSCPKLTTIDGTYHPFPKFIGIR